jgi:hypothetical protein
MEFDVVLTDEGKKRQNRINNEIKAKIDFESKQHSFQF